MAARSLDKGAQQQYYVQLLKLDVTLAYEKTSTIPLHKYIKTWVKSTETIFTRGIANEWRIAQSYTPWLTLLVSVKTKILVL